jgi:hypothetical protein
MNKEYFRGLLVVYLLIIGLLATNYTVKFLIQETRAPALINYYH